MWWEYGGKVKEKACGGKIPGPMPIVFTEFSNGLLLFFLPFPELPKNN